MQHPRIETSIEARRKMLFNALVEGIRENYPRVTLNEDRTFVRISSQDFLALMGFDEADKLFPARLYENGKKLGSPV